MAEREREREREDSKIAAIFCHRPDALYVSAIILSISLDLRSQKHVAWPKRESGKRGTRLHGLKTVCRAGIGYAYFSSTAACSDIE